MQIPVRTWCLLFVLSRRRLAVFSGIKKKRAKPEMDNYGEAAAVDAAFAKVRGKRT